MNEYETRAFFGMPPVGGIIATHYGNQRGPMPIKYEDPCEHCEKGLDEHKRPCLFCKGTGMKKFEYWNS